jgi:tRNA (guanine10-N2)-methyltransferase
MKLVSNSEQNFGAWSRRLITMQKVAEVHKGEHASIEVHHHSENDVTANRVEEQLKLREEEQSKQQPGHYAFREKVGSTDTNDGMVWDMILIECSLVFWLSLINK